jgi:putative flippase GtrA
MERIESARQWARSLTGEEQRKIVKFILSGVMKTACGYGLFLLVLWTGLHRDIALATDYLFAATVGYVVNRSWTFPNQGHQSYRILKYVLAYVLVFVLNSFALDVTVRSGMEPAKGQILCLVPATVASYLLQRYWVFQGRQFDTK